MIYSGAGMTEEQRVRASKSKTVIRKLTIVIICLP